MEALNSTQTWHSIKRSLQPTCPCQRPTKTPSSSFWQGGGWTGSKFDFKLTGNSISWEYRYWALPKHQRDRFVKKNKSFNEFLHTVSSQIPASLLDTRSSRLFPRAWSHGRVESLYKKKAFRHVCCLLQIYLANFTLFLLATIWFTDLFQAYLTKVLKFNYKNIHLYMLLLQLYNSMYHFILTTQIYKGV